MLLKKDPTRMKDVIDLNDNSSKKKAFINLDDDGPGSEQLGTLIVVLLKAKNLNDKHFRKQDAYAQATLNGITKKTKVDARAGQHPVWDQEVRFPIVKSKRARNRKLEVACYSQEPSPLPDQLLGKAVIDLTEMLKTGEFDEWVELQVDGVQRGEVYLEMTYFSNEPEPEKPSQPAPAPKNKLLSNFLETDSVHLQRRPSKLSAADRLSRPRQTSGSLASQTSFDPQPPGAFPQLSYSPPVQQQPLPNQGGRLPASLTPSYRTSPPSRRDPLPPQSGPEIHESLLPSLLRPGGGRTPPSSSPIPTTQLLLPTSYGNNRRPSPSPPSQSPYLGPQFQNSPPIPASLNPYVGGAISPAPAPAQNPHLIMQGSPQSLPGASTTPWGQDSYFSPVIDSGIQGAGGFAFPPVNTGHHVQDPLGGVYASPPQFGYSRPTHVRAGSDPLLLARYSTPLPLPPGVRPSAQPVPVAPPPSTEIPPPSSPPELPSKVNQPPSDQTRFEALRRAEEEAKRRHEQELRDLELAMKLDRELNYS